MTFNGFHCISNVKFRQSGYIFMSQRYIPVLLLAAFLAGCGGNPFYEPAEETPVDPGPVTPVVPGEPPAALPGTTAPTTSKAITRYEERNTPQAGNGYAESITYNGDNGGPDTFTVDNLAFDGANTFTRNGPVPSLGAYTVYEAAGVVLDPQSGATINQFEHRLIAGKGAHTSFQIVRTGSYVGYGFGGFVLMRDASGVVLPDGTQGSGQAAYRGRYAGLRDFDGRSGLQLTDGDMTVDIDFRDFNKGDAVKGEIFNRRIMDLNGTDITASVLAQMDIQYNPGNVGPPLSALPVMTFKVGPGAIDANGEIRGNLGSFVVDYRPQNPTETAFEVGNYYAIVSGPDAVGQEVVGIFVVESPTPNRGGVTTRETGGFILVR